MNRLRGIFAASLGALLASGCAITPKTAIRAPLVCDLKPLHLEVELPGDGLAPHSVGGVPSFAAALRRSISEPRPQSLPAPGEQPEQPLSQSMLFLSGGSQNGAFGAGFLDGWAQNRQSDDSTRRGKLPRFKVVTGISTGAILASFAFLGETEVAARYYRIGGESDVLRPFVKSSKLGLATLPTIARKGAVGELDPLRQKLRSEINDARLRAIAWEHEKEGRKLYVGAVDIDMAQAVAFDLTAAASRYAAPEADAATRELLRDCYVEAIIASASVPLAAPPVFLDNRMYIDGGARFGVFSEEIGKAVGARPEAPAPPAESVVAAAVVARPSIYVLINGDLTTNADCGKLDGCKVDMWAIEGAHKKWKLPDMALRSVSVLINQVYRFSTERALSHASLLNFKPRLVRINADAAAHRFTIEGKTLPCAEWQAMDAREDRPLEFHRRYMHCLVDYGIERARASKWICAEEPDVRKCLEALPPGHPARKDHAR